jgi:GAF domain-containing protein
MVPDAQSDPRFASHPLVTGPPFLRFYAGVPLRIDGGAPLGTLCVIDRDPRVLASDQREALEALARQVVSQVRLRERTAALERSSAELTALEEMGEYLQSCRSLEESSRVISTYGARLFSRLPGFVAMTNPVGRLVESFAAWGGAAPAPFALDECWALRRGRRYEVAPGRPSIVCAHVGDHGSGAHVCVPMMAHGETLGVVHLSRSSPRAITAGELQLATATAERLSLALGNIRLRATLRERDSLLPSAPAPSVAERPPSVRAPILPAVSAALSAAARRVPPTN